MKKTIYELEEYVNIYDNEKKNLAKEIQMFPECVVLKKNFVGDFFSDYHHHALYEILFVKSGKVKYSIEEKKYILNSGDVIFIAPSKLHKLDSIESTSCERIVINFSKDFIDNLSTEQTDLLRIFKLIDESKNYKLKIHLNNITKINKIFDLLQTTQFENEYGSDLVFKTSFTQLLLMFNAMYDNTAEVDEPLITNAVVDKIHNFIMDNIDKQLLIEHIAAHVNLSSSRVQHIFKDETGISLNVYITKKKLLKATELLRDNKKSIDIFEKCGFQNYTSFLRAFKNEYGCTPKEYINSYKVKYTDKYNEF